MASGGPTSRLSLFLRNLPSTNFACGSRAAIMAKLKQDEITIADLVEFIEDQSDFGFEIQVLNALVNEQFECEHGGTYEDRATGKSRQFDIRAKNLFGRARFRNRVRLAVECKNL